MGNTVSTSGSRSQNLSLKKNLEVFLEKGAANERYQNLLKVSHQVFFFQYHLNSHENLKEKEKKKEKKKKRKRKRNNG